MTGVSASDSYVEQCWLPIVGPTTFALVRRVNDLTGPVGAEPTTIPCEELSRMLGLGNAGQPTRNNAIGKTLWRARQFGVGWCDLRSGTFELPEPLPLVPARLAANLPVRSWQEHAAHVDQLTNRLAQAGIERPADVLGAADNARRSLRNRRCPEGLDAVALQAAHELPAASL